MIRPVAHAAFALSTLAPAPASPTASVLPTPFSARASASVGAILAVVLPTPLSAAASARASPTASVSFMLALHVGWSCCLCLGSGRRAGGRSPRCEHVMEQASMFIEYFRVAGHRLARGCIIGAPTTQRGAPRNGSQIAERREHGRRTRPTAHRSASWNVDALSALPACILPGGEADAVYIPGSHEAPFLEGGGQFGYMSRGAQFANSSGVLFFS